ncbi:hypothetical protein CRN79_01205 [Serratia fonticola]|uniref:hypothetical protein n=1 Tax=Serratia fonticola TaxID=47917 RepID=UPI000BFB7C17|nr:hypothetical protein [Serratia fonticola]ATM74544.1 hypothetical protein CRN79_01205 [Serratia fonticola]
MNYLFEALFLMIFIFLALCVQSNRTAVRSILIGVLVVYLFMYDYVNYYLGVISGTEIIIYKLGVEFILLSALFKMFFSRKISRPSFKYLMIVSLIVLISAIFGLVGGATAKSVYTDFRDIFSSIFLAILLVITSKNPEAELSVFIKVFFVMATINGVVAVHEYITYTGNYESLWRYQSLLDSKLRVNDSYNTGQLIYQIVRDDNLRASGFLISALIASYVYGFFLVKIICDIIILKKKNNMMFNIFYFLLYLLFSYVTMVRTGVLMVVIAFVIILIFKLISSDKLRKISAIIFSLSLVSLLFLYLSSDFEFSKDASSQGRLLQYITFFNDFTPLGRGLGSYPGAFDSYYIYTLLELGIGAIIFIFVLISLATSVAKNDEAVSNQMNKRLRLCVLVQLAIFLFVCSFQHIAGSVYYTLLILYIVYNSKLKYKTSVS